MLDVWECYDRSTRTLSSWVEGSLEPVRPQAPWPYRYMQGYPVEFLRFQVVPDRLHGPGVLAYMTHPHKMRQDMAHRIGTHVKHASTKWTLRSAALLHQENVEQIRTDIQNPEMDAVIEVTENPAGNEVLKPIQPNVLDPAFGALFNLLDQADQEASGLNDAARGTITGATATEVTKAGAATQIVMSDNAKKVRRGLTNCMRKLLAIARQWMPEYLILPPMGGDRQDFMEFHRGDLAGDYHVTVELPLPSDLQRDINNIINARHELMNSPNVQGEGMRELEREVLRRLGLHELDRFMPEPSADVQKAVALEHQVMMAGQAVQPSPGENSTYHLEQHTELLNKIGPQVQQMTQQYQRQAQAAMMQAQPQQAMMMQMGQMEQMGQNGQGAPGQMPPPPMFFTIKRGFPGTCLPRCLVMMRPSISVGPPAG